MVAIVIVSNNINSNSNLIPHYTCLRKKILLSMYVNILDKGRSETWEERSGPLGSVTPKSREAQTASLREGSELAPRGVF